MGRLARTGTICLLAIGMGVAADVRPASVAASAVLHGIILGVALWLPRGAP